MDIDDEVMPNRAQIIKMVQSREIDNFISRCGKQNKVKIRQIVHDYLNIRGRIEFAIVALAHIEFVNEREFAEYVNACYSRRILPYLIRWYRGESIDQIALSI